jgi:transposase-like protein
MTMTTNEQALRREAIRRRLQGERRCDICRDLHRATSWFDKWWAAYRRDPLTDFADRPRTPHHSPQQMPDTVVQAVIAERQVLEQAATPATRYGLIGAHAIWARLKELHIVPLPSEPTIQRILAQHQLTHPIGAGAAAAYYPWPVAWEVNAIFATDIITKHVHGGTEIQNFHTIDHASHAICLSQHLDKTSQTTRAHLLHCWTTLGLPSMHQFDNEGTFCGGHTHRQVLGQIVRLCLFCGIEPLFTPYYEPKRNYQIENFHSLWVRSFWARHTFANRDEVQTETPLFWRWYMYHYYPPALAGRTPMQVRRGAGIHRLSAPLRRLIPEGRVPLSVGRIHFMRKVDSAGAIEVLNDVWQLGMQWSGDYVRATIDTQKQTIGFWHQSSAEAAWHRIKTRRFQIKETVHAVLPEFRRTCTRCRECFPG